jgi:DNA-dependent RNA polymerase auxiliary subunit epsilon
MPLFFLLLYRTMQKPCEDIEVKHYVCTFSEYYHGTEPRSEDHNESWALVIRKGTETEEPIRHYKEDEDEFKIEFIEKVIDSLRKKFKDVCWAKTPEGRQAIKGKYYCGYNTNLK